MSLSKKTAFSIVFSKPQEGFSPLFEVAGCYLEHNGRFLLVKVAPHKAYAGTWSCAGGKCEKGETPEHAVIREIQEEVGITLDKKDLIFCGTFFVHYPKTDFVYHIFHAKFLRQPEIILSNEHVEYRWVTREEALELPLILGEEECFAHVFGGNLE